MNINQILDQYRNADSNHRLLMFMQYREHRSFFENIESEELQMNSATTEITLEPRRMRSHVSRTIRWCYSLFS